MKSRHASEWTDEELQAILSAAQSFKGHYRINAARGEGVVAKSTWWTAYILASHNTGFTRKSLMAISRRMIAANGTAVLRPAGTGMDVIIRFRSDTMKAFSAIPTRRMILGFPDSPKAAAFNRDWSEILALASLTTNDRLVCNPHGKTLTDAKSGSALDQPDSLCDYFERVFVPLRLRSKSGRTKSLYLTTLRNVGRFLGRLPMMSDLNDLTAAQYLAWVRERNRSPHTVDKERSNLLALWRFACLRKLVTEYPNVEKETLPRRAPLAWQQHELQQLFAAIDSTKGRIGRIRASRWWRALHLVIWDSGERISAIMGLRWDHVDLEEGWLSVPCELRKGRGEDKVFRLARDTMIALARIKRNSSDSVFPWPYTMSSLWPRYAQLLKDAGLPHDKRSKFHRMRRTVASFFEAAGGDATALLGHSARAVTTKHYIDERIVKPKQAAELLFRPDLAEAAVTVAARCNSPHELLKLGTGVIDVTR